VSVERLPTPAELAAEAVRVREAIDHLEQLQPDDLRRLMAFLNAQVAMARGHGFVDAVVVSAAAAGMTAPPATADPIAWLDQELAALAGSITLILNARGALGNGC
jgi:hypothetical protein